MNSSPSTSRRFSTNPPSKQRPGGPELHWASLRRTGRRQAWKQHTSTGSFCTSSTSHERRAGCGTGRLPCPAASPLVSTDLISSRPICDASHGPIASRTAAANASAICRKPQRGGSRSTTHRQCRGRRCARHHRAQQRRISTRPRPLPLGGLRHLPHCRGAEPEGAGASIASRRTRTSSGAEDKLRNRSRGLSGRRRTPDRRRPYSTLEEP